VAIGLLMMLPGGTQEAYEQVNEKMFGSSSPSSDEAPEGLLVHSAGPSSDGWYVYDMWESKDHFQRFADEMLIPAVQEVAPDQMGGEPQFFEIHNLVQAG
jgi:hypothetical protein